jgi:gliding motility-associated-like protein
MKKFTIVLFLVCLMDIGYSQVVTNNTNTVANYVQNILLGGGVSVSNITVNGAPANVPNAQIGEFTDATSSIGLPNGMILGSGDVSLAAQPNIGGGSSLGGTGSSGTDPDLSAINAPSAIFDEIILEFDFIPVGDTLRFNYVFASEEYEEYVCGTVNDVFGFFLTGNNPSGGTYTSQNIALIPDPLVPGTFTNTPVTINTVNPGVAGTNGTASNCAALDPNWASYNVFYQSNTGGTSYEYDGRTTLLPIEALVNCGESYHIKIAIADVLDAVFDSGVFLEAGSFGTNGTVDATTAVVPPNITLCDAPYTINLSNGANTVPQNYWDFGDGIGTDTAANPVYTYADTGSYIVMYVAIDSSACIPTDTAYFNVDIIKKDSLDAQFTFPIYDPCVDSLTIQLDFTGTGADSLYWDMGNGTTFINDTSITYTYTTPGNYVVTFEAYDLLCNGTFILSDTVFFNPVITTVNAVPPPDVFLCSAPYIVNFAGNTPAPPNNYWDFGDGSGIDTTLNPSYTYGDTGTYQVMYVAIDSSTCNIADTAFFNVTVNQNDSLNAQFTFPPYDPCVDSLTVQLDFTGTGADSLYWDMGNGAIFINDTSITYTYNSPGTYVVTFEAYDFTCNNTATIVDTVFFNPVTTTVNAVVPPNVFLCTGLLTINFNGNAPAPPNNYWDFGDGSGTSLLLNPAYTYSDTGTYQVMYVAIDSSTCNIADTAFFSVELAQAPPFSASIDFTPPIPCETRDSFLVDIIFTGVGADSLYWNMGDGTEFINVDSTVYQYMNSGTYTITMSVFNFQCNINKTVSSDVTFVDPVVSEGIIPNVFTPNGDGMNDKLIFGGVDADAEFDLQIFNRWGAKVFETTDATDYWDGGGKSIGTYFYILTYTDVCSEEEKQEKGTVTLLR